MIILFIFIFFIYLQGERVVFFFRNPKTENSLEGPLGDRWWSQMQAPSYLGVLCWSYLWFILAICQAIFKALIVFYGSRVDVVCNLCASFVCK